MFNPKQKQNIPELLCLLALQHCFLKTNKSQLIIIHQQLLSANWQNCNIENRSNRWGWTQIKTQMHHLIDSIFVLNFFPVWIEYQSTSGCHKLFNAIKQKSEREKKIKAHFSYWLCERTMLFNYGPPFVCIWNMNATIHKAHIYHTQTHGNANFRFYLIWKLEGAITAAKRTFCCVHCTGVVHFIIAENVV